MQLPSNQPTNIVTHLLIKNSNGQLGNRVPLPIPRNREISSMKIRKMISAEIGNISITLEIVGSGEGMSDADRQSISANLNNQWNFLPEKYNSILAKYFDENSDMKKILTQACQGINLSECKERIDNASLFSFLDTHSKLQSNDLGIRKRLTENNTIPTKSSPQ